MRTFEEVQDELRECIGHAYRDDVEDIQKFGGNIEHLDKATHLLNELIEVHKGEWIPVSERLPENDTEVIYCDKTGVVGNCHYFKSFNQYPGCDDRWIFDDIVAWLPIPKPYKAESEE